jgi:hypothetical protein
MPELTTIERIRARLRAVRLLIIGLNDPRLRDLDTLLSVAEAEAERHQTETEHGTARTQRRDG